MKSSRPEIEPQVRVLLVNQDAAFGRRLMQVFASPGGFQLCAQVSDAASAQVAVAAHDPGLIVADTELDTSGGFQMVCRLAASGMGCRVLATARVPDPVLAEQVLLAGARGLLLVSEPAEEILNAFTTVVRGQIYVSRSVTMPLIKRLLSKPTESARSGVESFTDRELRVFEMLGCGLSTREIAARLGLSCKTIENHREKIKHRLGVGSAAALAQCACAWVQRGLRSSDALASGADTPSRRAAGIGQVKSLR